MKVYNHINEFTKLDKAVVTIGTFDGVHIGHQKIISRLKQLAAELGGETVILTFFPHPRLILHPEDQKLKMLTTMDEKIELLEKAGVNHLIITPFTRDFSNQTPQEYIQQVLVDKIGTKQIVIGYDHRFGKDRAGCLADLQNFAPVYGFEVEEIPEEDIQNVAVSSTQVRNALLAGEIDKANSFLGYPFHITGKVIKGDQLGRTLGFPTANLFVEESYKLIPADGIYAVTVEVKVVKDKALTSKISHLKSYNAMGYIGHRPTINGMSRNIEVNLFDFDQDIYGQIIRIYFNHFIRADIKFDSLEELKAQLSADKKSASDLLA
ncbi:MAG: bifunctional riboflavin kinase/FAD synthetase [Sphingobacteriaceae bacterium]|jgi:riboflavin kinase/FMN adenylyltransferase|nr:bifunctional riboflavin kinase/FAD synthetase [Sphingobacteriaceae bacterium]